LADPDDTPELEVSSPSACACWRRARRWSRGDVLSRRTVFCRWQASGILRPKSGRQRQHTVVQFLVSSERPVCRWPVLWQD